LFFNSFFKPIYRLSFLFLAYIQSAVAADCDIAQHSESSSLTSKSVPLHITGFRSIDQHIFKLAQSRGYKLQTRWSNNRSLTAGHYVHRCVSEDLQELLKSAREQGYPLQVLSGFRSIERQREIFLTKLFNRGVSLASIPNGSQDKILNSILNFSAAPGYSRHHSGFAVDLYETGRTLALFRSSEVFKWLSANNYSVARSFGFIPSYPEGLQNQGPLPESWEFLWVGRTSLNYGEKSFAALNASLGTTLANDARTIIEHLQKQPFFGTDSGFSDLPVTKDQFPGG
jgi:LAS superfamily LD-carboxypeptidase LdcB